VWGKESHIVFSLSLFNTYSIIILTFKRTFNNQFSLNSSTPEITTLFFIFFSSPIE